MKNKLFGIMAVLSMVFVSGCVTYESEVTISRPKDEVETAIENAQEKLGSTTGHIHSFMFPDWGFLLAPLDVRESDGNTAFSLPLGSFPSQQNLIEIQKRVLLQELYRDEGNNLPPNPSYFKEKNGFAMFGISLLNVGWAYYYIYHNNVYWGPDAERAGKPAFLVLGIADGLAALLTVGGVLGSVLAPESQGMTENITMIGLYAWASIKFGFAYDLYLQKPRYIHYHNALLASGYNWDPEFRVEQVSGIDYEISHTPLGDE